MTRTASVDFKSPGIKSNIYIAPCSAEVPTELKKGLPTSYRLLGQGLLQNEDLWMDEEQSGGSFTIAFDRFDRDQVAPVTSADGVALYVLAQDKSMARYFPWVTTQLLREFTHFNIRATHGVATIYSDKLMYPWPQRVLRRIKQLFTGRTTA